MPKLSATQSKLLNLAAERDDGAACVPNKMNRAASKKLASGLVELKLMREVFSKGGMPIWRKNDEGRVLSLVITSAGRKLAAKVGEQSITLISATSASVPVPRDIEKREAMLETPSSGKSKRQSLIDMLSRSDGATLDQMVSALGWLPHTTRAELTRLRHRGVSIIRTPRKDQPSLYSLATSAKTNDRVEVGKAA